VAKRGESRHDIYKVIEGIDMQKHITSIICVLSVALLAGCNNGKSPEAVTKDVAAAQQNAATDVADAQKDAAKENAAGSAKVDDKSKALNNTEASGAYDVAMAKAEGTHKISLEKCNAMSGDVQSQCKKQADADYDAAKAQAKATEGSKKE
jgi:hypothetical protein